MNHQRILVQVLFFLVSFSVFSQEVKSNSIENEIKYDKKVYIYETFNDFENDIKKFIGYYHGWEWNSGFSITFGGKLKLKVKNSPDSEDFESVKMDNYWGFVIDNYIFRITKNRMLAVINKKHEKYFYLDGMFVLSMILNESDSANLSFVAEKDLIFYSNNLNSKVFRIQKIKREKSSELTSLRKCIKKAKKRKSVQGRFNS